MAGSKHQQDDDTPLEVPIRKRVKQSQGNMGSTRLEESSRMILRSFWDSIDARRRPPPIKVTWDIKRAASYFLRQRDGSTDDETKSPSDGANIEEIPRKERPPHVPRFKKKKRRQQANWLKYCLTKAFHRSKYDMWTRQERRTFDRERTVWKWVGKYRRETARRVEMKGIVDRWVEDYKRGGRV